MTPVDRFLHDLDGELRVRGRARRRLLDECRDHLDESVAAVGPEEALRQFGSAVQLARAYELEVTAARSIRATVVVMVGVVAMAWSTLAIIGAAEPGARATPVWEIAFFASAQICAVTSGLAVLRALSMRRTCAHIAEVTLLRRRAWSAVLFAVLTLVAAAGAVPGRLPVWEVALGPAACVVASAALVGARARTGAPHRSPAVVRSAGADVLTILGRARDAVDQSTPPGAWIGVVVGVAASGAFCWSRLDHGTVGASMVVSGVEAALVVAAYAVLGPSLGLRRGRRREAA